MQRVTERLERGLLEPLALRRVRMDRAGDILKPRAHFQRKAECGGEFGYAVADRLDAEDEMVVGARNSSHEPVLTEHRHGATIGRERKLPDLDFAAELCAPRPATGRR